jgi:hypothetical protein
VTADCGAGAWQPLRTIVPANSTGQRGWAEFHFIGALIDLLPLMTAPGADAARTF